MLLVHLVYHFLSNRDRRCITIRRINELLMGCASSRYTIQWFTIQRQAFIQAVLLMSVYWTNKDWVFKCCKRLSFQVLRCCKLHNGFMTESCWGFRKSLKNVHLFTSGGQINSLTLQINLFWMQVPCQHALK